MRDRTRARLRRNAIEVTPGAWIRVPVPGDPFPVSMRVGNGIEVPAFIDHEPDGSTVAAVRCPQLRAGDYPVTVRLPGGSTVSAEVTVI